MNTSRLADCLALLVLSSALVGCTGQEVNTTSTPTGDRRGGKLKVVCTTTMIEDMVRNLAEDKVEVIGFMKAGQDPHTYEITPRDGDKIGEADLVLANGYHLEATLGHVLEAHAKKDAVVQLAELAVDEPLASGGLPDPHCWMSIANFRGYTEHARDALIKIDPDNADTYRASAERYLVELDELDTWIRTELAKVPKERRVMITGHDAFQYLGAAYEIEVHAMIGLSTEAEVKPQDIEAIKTLIRERGIKAIFVESSVSASLNNHMKNSADKTGIEIGGELLSDSLAAPGKPGDTYIEMMKHNISTIVGALQ